MKYNKERKKQAVITNEPFSCHANGYGENGIAVQLIIKFRSSNDSWNGNTMKLLNQCENLCQVL